MIEIFFSVSFFLFPGLLLLAIPHAKFFPKLSLIEKLPVIIAASLAYWIASFWFLRYIPIPLHLSLYTTIGISASLFVFLLIKRKITIKAGKQNAVVGIFFLILAVPACIVAFHEVAPSGADMSMQAYVAKVIALTNGFPQTLEPIVPVAQFGTYPVGFPILIASLMKTNAFPITTNALWLSVFTYWFFAVSVFVLLRFSFSIYTSIIVAIIISWISSTPLDFIPWGAHPTILSLIFLIFAITTMLHLKDNIAIGIALFFIYASGLTHYILPAAIFYLLICFIPFYWSSIVRLSQSWKEFRYILLLSLIVMLPWIMHIIQHLGNVSPSTLSFVASLQRDEVMKWSGELETPIAALVILYKFYTHTFGTPLFISYLLSHFVLLFIRPKSILFHIVAVVGMSILILNALNWWLPLSFLLYPKRIVLILLVPMALSIADALQFGIHAIYKHFIIHNTRNNMLLHVLVALLLWFIYEPHLRIAFRGYTQQSYLYVVTPEDITAMQWLATNTSPTDIIRNNYWDAGLWIPAIADRKITRYHTNPFDMDILKNEGQETYAYVGKKTLTNPQEADPVNRETLSNDPEHFTLVYDRGGVAIYKINREK